MTVTLPSKSVTLPIDQHTIEDVRRTIGKETEKIAEIAAHYGREAGETLAQGSRKAAADLGNNAHGWADRLRQLRITTEPPRRLGMLPMMLILAGLTIGLALAYFYATDQGRKMRDQLQRRMTARAEHAREAAEQAAEDVQEQVNAASPDADTAAWSIPVVKDQIGEDSAATVG